MSISYQKVWRTMNDLEVVTSKICSAREILECTIEAHENRNHERVEHLLHAVDEFLVYYLQEFDDKFRLAWQATVGSLRDSDVKKWDAWEETYYPEEVKETPKKWVIPVEIDPSGEYFVTFPDDLMEAANLEEGDSVEWIDNHDGSFLLKKSQPSWVEGNELAKEKTYDEMIAAGYIMTGDGFWVKE